MLPDPFAEPLEFLTACHGRIRLRLAHFREAAAALREGRTVPRHELEAALLFFRSSGAMHTVDEEQSLFPRLRARLLGEARERLDELEREHREHEAIFAELEAALRAIDPTLGEGDALPDPDAPPLSGGTPEAEAAAAALVRIADEYEAHIPVEDGWLFPLAAEVLPAFELEALATELRGRHRLGAKLFRPR